MNNSELEQLKYPIGQFECPNEISKDHIDSWIDILEQFPDRISTLVENLTDAQLNTPYRPDGWTIRQVIHHVSDSHHHSYIRFKWALTEENPLIKAYFEDRWAELFDYKEGPIQLSLDHLRVVHVKLVFLLKGLKLEDLDKTFLHPESQQTVSLKKNIGVYAWHSNHHYEHINQLMKRKDWH